MDNSLERIDIVVRGRVQGVGYRYFVACSARELAVAGYVRNMPDGSVEIRAEGDRDSLEKLIAICRQGPPMSIVREINVQWDQATGEFKSFIIAY